MSNYFRIGLAAPGDDLLISTSNILMQIMQIYPILVGFLVSSVMFESYKQVTALCQNE